MRTDFKGVKWNEQAQDGLKFVNIMKTDVQISSYKSRKFINPLNTELNPICQ
jgi:hypothetical protein